MTPGSACSALLFIQYQLNNIFTAIPAPQYSLYIQLNNNYTIMSHTQILLNTFDTKTLNQLLRKLEFVSFDQQPEKVMKDLEELSPEEYLWAVCYNPAYFVQYQIKSAAVIKIKNLVLIVWRPKYIEYPTMIKFPELKDKKPNNLKIIFEEGTTTTNQTNECVTSFLEGYYSTFFHSDEEFETNLISKCKHFMSRVTQHNYWHAIMDDADCLFVTQMAKMDNVCKVRITGMKEGYDKTLLFFSYKGQKGSLLQQSAKGKWMQLMSFIAMLVIFYFITSCEADSQEGVCFYRNEVTMMAAGSMFALIGLRYMKDKKANKKKGKLPADPSNKQA